MRFHNVCTMVFKLGYRELYHLLCREAWLRAAHHAVNANQGRETAGVDSKTMSHFNGDVDRPTVSLLMIPLVYCHIKSFQRASIMKKPFPGGEKRRDRRAAHHKESEAIESLLLPYAAPGVSLLAVGAGAVPRLGGSRGRLQ
jgi:hypothetical protein